MEQLIVVFTVKRNIGLTAIPYSASFEENQPITLHEHVTVSHLTQNLAKYNEDQKELIKILSGISEQSLFKKFAKEGTLKEFIDKLPLHKLYESHIRVHIEQTLYKAVRKLSGTVINAYFKDDTFSNLYQSDKLILFPNAAEPVFTFELKEEGLVYALKIKQPGYKGSETKEFSLYGRDVEFICDEPAVIKIHQTLYYFEHIDSKKFKPFTGKTTITVPSRQVEPYMESFVTNCVRNYDVFATGFDIENTLDTPLANLLIKKDLQQQPVFALHFKYGEKSFLADRIAPVFVRLTKQDDKYVFQKISRNFSYEHDIIAFITSLGLEKSGDALFYPSVAESDATERLATISDWINQNREALDSRGIVFSNSFDNREIFVGKAHLEIKDHEGNDWFEIRAQVKLGEFTIPFMKFRKNLIDRKPEYELPNGQIFMIPQEWFTRFSELFNYAKVENDMLRLPRSHFRIMEQVKHGISHIENGEKDQKISFPEVAVPSGINATLRPYQIDGFGWMTFLLENGFGGILADDMGLGKTLQTITLLQKIYQNEPKPERVEIEDESFHEEVVNEKVPKQLFIFDTPKVKVFNQTGVAASLIVMPTSLVHNWLDEVRKFAPSLKCYNYTGVNRLRTKEIGKIFRHYHLVITSYGILRNDIELLSHYKFHYFIMDESQYVKNPTSKVYEAVKNIQSVNRLTLTGTPIENSLIDLWAQMNLVNKGLLGSLSFFKRYFAQPIMRNQDEEKEVKLRRLIQPFLLRRTKENVAKDLPPIMEQVLYCDMTPEQASIYEREKSGIRNSIYKIFEYKTADQSAIMALQALTRLRQIANHPLMIDAGYTGSSGKFEQIIDHLESIVAENHNVLVFSSFVKDLEIIEKEISKRNLSYVKLTGATRERAKVIKDFNDQASIFLISLKAGGVGLNLTKADYVFMLNPWWNPAAEAQAINRAHRIGQTKNVFVYRFLSTGTIEEKIAKLQQKKSQLADNFVNNTNPLTDLSKEEIIELFS
jgi:superfamily II DNA or RNA helicase